MRKLVGKKCLRSQGFSAILNCSSSDSVLWELTSHIAKIQRTLALKFLEENLNQSLSFTSKTGELSEPREQGYTSKGDMTMPGMLSEEHCMPYTISLNPL